MTKTKLLTAVVMLLTPITTPVLAQEMGGAMGPGSSYGLEPSASSSSFGYYDGWRGARSRDNSYAMYNGTDRAWVRPRRPGRNTEVRSFGRLR